MKLIRFFSYTAVSVLFCFALAGCEIDNYDAPDCTIEGTIYDHHGQPFQFNHGREVIRSREISWAKDDDTYIANRMLKVQQDGTYRHTKMFSGTYRLLPYSGAFFPYDDINRESDDAGELVEIKGKVTRDFTLVPFLTLEWVQEPYVDADGHLVCSAKFTRNQKSGYDMPDVYRGNMQISRTVNAEAADGTLFTVFSVSNSQEGNEIVFKSRIPLRWTGINYWVRLSFEVRTASGGTAYQGLPASNYTTIKQIFVP